MPPTVADYGRETQHDPSAFWNSTGRHLFNQVMSDAGYNFEILDAVIEVNDVQKRILIPRIEAFFNGNVAGKTIAVWGLSFKPETDDIREAPALYIIEDLLQKGANIKAFDPETMPNVKRRFGNQIEYCLNKYEAIEEADALIICTEWSIFRTPDFERLKKSLKQPAIFDGRNLFEIEEMKKEGIYYSSIGRKTTN